MEGRADSQRDGEWWAVRWWGLDAVGAKVHLPPGTLSPVSRQQSGLQVPTAVGEGECPSQTGTPSFLEPQQHREWTPRESFKLIASRYINNYRVTDTVVPKL